MAKEQTAAPRQGRRTAYLMLAGCLLGWAGSAAAAPPVSQMLGYKPRQDGVSYTSPAAGSEANCKVELIKGQGNGSGWLLRDDKGQALRLFFDSNGSGKPNVWSYYKDGVEVYREIDSKYVGKPDNYRWLNSAGSKWGVDEAREGRIKYWKVISPEEISQEIVQALVKKDAARLQALLISEEEIKALGLPTDMAARIRDSVKAAPAKFKDTTAKLTSLSASTVWVHLETAAPQCLPSDQTGARVDIVRHSRGTILVDVGNGKNEWIQTGEMLKVGDAAWRLTEAPTSGVTAEPAPETNPALQKLLEELSVLDKNPPASTGGADPVATTHHLKRADLLEKIVAASAESEREQWIRQLADSLSTASQSSAAGDKRAYERLLALEKQLTAKLPGHNLTAYVTFREMQAEYAAKLTVKDVQFDKVQGEWIERLSKFVGTYPKAEDTPDALLQLGMVSEFLNKDVDAKNWYAQLAKNFADKPQGQKAAGAIERLGLEGKVLKLAGPTLADAKVSFDVDQLRGKTVVVYYWASWNSQCVGDFAKLKLIVEANKGAVELLCVNLDNKASEAQEFLTKNPVAGKHLYQENGLEGKLATQYGVTVLPTMFLVDKTGKVVSRNAQIGTLEDEIKKLLK